MWWIKTQKIIHRLNFSVAVVGMVFILPLMLLTTGDVLGRKFLSKTIPGTFEISEYILATFILLGAAYTQQVRGHVGVDFLTSRISHRARIACEMITTLLSLFIIGIVVWMGWVEGIGERAVSDQLRIPQYPFRILVAVGGFLLWLELLIDLLNSIGKLKRRKA